MADYTPKAHKWSEAEMVELKSGLLPVEETSNLNKNVIAERKNAVLKVRERRIGLNICGYNGGGPYIERRLSRFPSEDDVSWEGDRKTNSDGRKQRAYLINYCLRIAHKINQFVFSEGVKREGIDEQFMLDVTTTGVSLQQFMNDVSSMITAARWGWVFVDRPKSTPGQSKADKERRGDRVYWRLLSPSEVVDWKFDDAGRLLWILTEGVRVKDDNPYKEVTNNKIRTLYMNDKVIEFIFDDKGDIETIKAEPNPLGIIPCVPCGVISDLPWWFDDVERMQKVQLDRGSAYDTALHQMCYPQPILPASAIDDATDIIQSRQLRYKIGIKSPVLETDTEKGITRFETADWGSLSAMREEINAGERQIFEIVGLAMSRPDSAQVESADAKKWNHLDAECVIRERAIMLEEIEKKCIALSKLVDSTFAEYEPEYSRRFDVQDLKEEFEAILTSNNAVDFPDEGKRELQHIIMDRLNKRFGIPEDRLQIIHDAIDTKDFEPMLYDAATDEDL